MQVSSNNFDLFTTSQKRFSPKIQTQKTQEPNTGIEDNESDSAEQRDVLDRIGMGLRF